ncbi:hypothetical protein B0H15DRAFT_740226, partial [Mycena belliarum]
KPQLRRITHRGVFTVEARKIMRLAVDAGCARGKIGPLLQRMGSIFGIRIAKSISRRTVSRVVLEGGIGSEMQIQYEASRNRAITISADSTSNRGINFESTHIACRAPNYAAGAHDVDLQSQPKLRLTGVHSTVDHSSAESASGWIKLRLQQF